MMSSTSYSAVFVRFRYPLPRRTTEVGKRGALVFSYGLYVGVCSQVCCALSLCPCPVLAVLPSVLPTTTDRAPAVPGSCPVATWSLSRPAVTIAMVALPVRYCRRRPKMAFRQLYQRGSETGVPGVKPLAVGSLVGWLTLLELGHFPAPWWLPPRREWLPCHWFGDLGSRCEAARRRFSVGWLEDA